MAVGINKSDSTVVYFSLLLDGRESEATTFAIKHIAVAIASV